MSLRVLWIAHFAGIDGANLNMVEGIDALAFLGHESHVVLPREGPLEARLVNAASVGFCHHNQWIASRHVGLARTARWLAYDRRVAARQLANIARDVDADVLVSNTAGVVAGALAARSAGLPHVWFFHELVSPDFGFRFLLGRRLTFFLIRRLATEVLALSPTVRAHFIDDLTGMEVPVIGCWAHVPQAESDGSPPPPADGSLRLVSVGSWIPGKAQSDAIGAVGALRRAGIDVQLDLVGGTEQWYLPELQRRVEAEGVADRVAFIAFQQDPTSHYLRAHAALMCSAHEGLGRAAIEPLKLGRPVIGAAGGGVLDVIEEGRNGLLYRPGDAEDLARRIRELDGDRELLRTLGDRARRDALARFSEERMGAALENALLRASHSKPNKT